MAKSFPHSFPQALDTIFIEFIAILPQNYQVFHIKMNRLFYWIPTGFPHFFSFPHRIVENLWKVLKNGDIRFCGKVFKKVKLL